MVVDTTKPILNQLVEFFQELTSNGEAANLFVESRTGKQVATLTLDIPVSSDTFQSTRPRMKPEKIKSQKSPSTLRRDYKRIKEFKEKKKALESTTSFVTSTPAKIETRNYFQSSKVDSGLENSFQLCSLLNMEVPSFKNVIFHVNKETSCEPLNIQTENCIIHPETPATPQENSTIHEEPLTIDSKALMNDILKSAKRALDMSFDKRFGPIAKEPLATENKSDENVDESGSFRKLALSIHELLKIESIFFFKANLSVFVSLSKYRFSSG